MNSHLYFAYGSNLHPVRLSQRVGPVDLVTVAQLPGRRLAFHKIGQDGSGKCDIPRCASGGVVYGVVYRLDVGQKIALDQYEGLGEGYSERQVTVSVANNHFRCSVYEAQQTHIDGRIQPFDWYKAMVLLGARYHEFPREYVDEIAAIGSTPDPDTNRHYKHRRLIENCRRFLVS